MVSQFRWARVAACSTFFIFSAAVAQTPSGSPTETAPQTASASQTAPATEAPRTTPHDRLVYAAEHSSLLGPDLTPWHLKLDVTVYDDKGVAPQTGTIESWHKKDAQLTVVTFGPAVLRRLKLGNKIFESKTDALVPQTTDLVLQNFVSPAPTSQQLDKYKLVLAKQKFGSIELDCVMLAPNTTDDNAVHFGSFPAYCLSQGADVIRIAYPAGPVALIRNRFTTFMGNDIARDLSLTRGGVKVADAKSTDLSSFTPTDDFFKPDATMKEVQHAVRISGGVVAGLKLSGDAPRYPESAKRDRLSGTVVLHAIITKEGSIKSLQVISSPSPEFSNAAVLAVNTWKYKPYLINGDPAEVDTMITVNFSLDIL